MLVTVSKRAAVSQFFIGRPIFAWVVALIIMLFGIVSITRLPISRYPNIAPPTVQISASYPGASAKTVEDSVTQIIEQNMNSLDGVLYMESVSDNNGNVTITLTFESGTDPDIAQVQVQNRLQQATPLLPQVVQQQGISVLQANSNFLLAIGFVSEDGRLSAREMSDYLATNVIDQVSRTPGVGSVYLFGDKHAMRIWLDPNKLNTYGLTPSDVIGAIQGQNALVSAGQLGAVPYVSGQQLNATVTALGRLQTPDQFGNIILVAVMGWLEFAAARRGARVELGQGSWR